MTVRPVLAVFILSGAAGLMYEVVWARQLVLMFGNTTQAVSAILTGFFGGMAIGSAIGGRIADRVRNGLRLYGVLEVVLVFVVLATPFTFGLIKEAYRGIYPVLREQPQVLALVRFALALLALGPATVLMGATLPSLTRYLSRDAGHLSAAFGRLYAANTIGAILGTAAAGLVLIELLGLMGTLIVGASCSAIAGLAALALSRRRLAGAATAHRVGGHVVEAVPEVSPAQSLAVELALGTRRRIALLVAFVSGLTSLGYQTLWTRLLANGTGNYTYVFTGILTTFLIGLALGAVTFSILRPRLRRPIASLALAQTAVAVVAALGVVLLTTRGMFAPLWQTVPLVVLPATIIMGLSFPLASALIASDDAHVGTDSGTLLAANTLGGITGTFIIPFFVIPAIGAPTAVGVLALVNLALAATLAVVGGRPAPTRRFALAINGVLAALLAVALATGGVFRDPTVARLATLEDAVLFASAEDEIAAVQAGAVDGQPQLWVTGTSMTLLTIDAKLMPILPLIARPN